MFAGFALDGAILKPDESSDKALYSKTSNSEIVAEAKIPAAAQCLFHNSISSPSDKSAGIVTPSNGVVAKTVPAEVWNAGRGIRANDVLPAQPGDSIWLPLAQPNRTLP